MVVLLKYVKNDSLWYLGVISKFFQKSNTNNIANSINSISSINSSNHKPTQLYDIFEIRYSYHKSKHIIHLHRSGCGDELREYHITTARLTFIENLMNS